MGSRRVQVSSQQALGLYCDLWTWAGVDLPLQAELHCEQHLYSLPPVLDTASELSLTVLSTSQALLGASTTHSKSLESQDSVWRPSAEPTHPPAPHCWVYCFL